MYICKYIYIYTYTRSHLSSPDELIIAMSDRYESTQDGYIQQVMEPVVTEEKYMPWDGQCADSNIAYTYSTQHTT